LTRSIILSIKPQDTIHWSILLHLTSSGICTQRSRTLTRGRSTLRSRCKSRQPPWQLCLNAALRQSVLLFLANFARSTGAMSAPLPHEPWNCLFERGSAGGQAAQQYFLVSLSADSAGLSLAPLALFSFSIRFLFLLGYEGSRVPLINRDDGVKIVPRAPALRGQVPACRLPIGWKSSALNFQANSNLSESRMPFVCLYCRNPANFPAIQQSSLHDLQLDKSPRGFLPSVRPILIVCVHFGSLRCYLLFILGGIITCSLTQLTDRTSLLTSTQQSI